MSNVVSFPGGEPKPLPQITDAVVLQILLATGNGGNVDPPKVEWAERLVGSYCDTILAIEQFSTLVALALLFDAEKPFADWAEKHLKVAVEDPIEALAALRNGFEVPELVGALWQYWTGAYRPNSTPFLTPVVSLGSMIRQAASGNWEKVAALLPQESAGFLDARAALCAPGKFVWFPPKPGATKLEDRRGSVAQLEFVTAMGLIGRSGKEAN